MDHTDFHIGREFWCADRLWRCTDVGRRVIVAIRIDEATARTVDTDKNIETERTMTGAEAEREGWFRGPPYKVLECVFDEYDLEGCTLGRDEAADLIGDLAAFAALRNQDVVGGVQYLGFEIAQRGRSVPIGRRRRVGARAGRDTQACGMAAAASRAGRERARRVSARLRRRALSIFSASLISASFARRGFEGGNDAGDFIVVAAER